MDNNMKQLVINIPDNEYLAFIKHIKSKFTKIEIKENKVITEGKILKKEDDTIEPMLLSEKSLAEEWLSDDDNRWDEVL